MAAWTTAAAQLDRMAETRAWSPRSATSPAHEHDVRARARPAGGPGFRGGLVLLRPPAHESFGRRCRLLVTVEDAEYSQRTRRRSRNRASHYTIRGIAVANRPPQPRPARGDGLVGGPVSGTRSPVHVRARPTPTSSNSARRQRN